MKICKALFVVLIAALVHLDGAQAQQTQSSVQTQINNNITTNGQQQITGAKLNSVLTTMNQAIFQQPALFLCQMAPASCASFYGYLDPRWWGAKCNWNGLTGADDSAAIAATIAYGNAQNGATIIMPPNLCAVSSTINFTSSHVSIVGAGNGSNGSAGVWSAAVTYGSGFVWTGTPGGTIINGAIPDVPSTAGYVGSGLHNLAFLGGPSVAGTAVKLIGAVGGEYSNLAFYNFATAGLDLDGYSDVSNSGTAHNFFYNIYSLNTTAAGAAIRFGCITGAGSFFNTFNVVTVLADSANNTGVKFCPSDNNEIFNLAVLQYGSGTNVSVAFESGAAANIVRHFSANAAAHAYTGATPANVLEDLDESNSTPKPIQDSGVPLIWNYMDGEPIVFTPVVVFGSTPCTAAGTPCVYSQTASYVRHGQNITASWRITFTTLGNGSGNVSLTGFPPLPVGGQVAIANCGYIGNVQTYSGAMAGYLNAASGTLNLTSSSTGTGLITAADFTGTTDIICSISYASALAP